MRARAAPAQADREATVIDAVIDAVRATVIDAVKDRVRDTVKAVDSEGRR